MAKDNRSQLGGSEDQQLPFETMDFVNCALSPLRELGAYEALWDNQNTSFKSLSKKFAERPDAMPSDFVPLKTADDYAALVKKRFEAANVLRFGVRVYGAGEYPAKLRDAMYPIGLCRKFCLGGRAGAVTPVCGRIRRPVSITIRPQ